MVIDRYNIEFILSARRITAEEIKNYLAEFVDKIEVSVCGEAEFKVSLRALDPTIIFDTCAQFGRIKSVKIDEGGR